MASARRSFSERIKEAAKKKLAYSITVGCYMVKYSDVRWKMHEIFLRNMYNCAIKIVKRRYNCTCGAIYSTYIYIYICGTR